MMKERRQLAGSFVEFLRGSSNSRRVLILYSLLLTAMVFSAYHSLPGHPFHNWDDGTYITKNEQVLKGLTAGSVKWAFTTDYFGFYYPLTWISHMTDVQLYGLSPRGHYVTNIILHALNVLLLFFFLSAATGKVNESLAVSALFALHPMNVETVAWLAERKNLLATFFMLAAMLFYIPAANPSNGGAKRFRCFLLVCLAFVLGLMSKPSIILFPFLLLLLDVWPLGRIVFPLDKDRKREFFRAAAEKAALIPFCLVSGILTIEAQKKVSALHTLDSLPVGERIGEALLGLGFYIGKLFAPFNLCTFYEHHRGHYPPYLPAALFILLAVITAASVIAGRKRPVFAVGWLFFLVSLLPVLGLIQAGDQGYADRYVYFAYWGLFFVLAFGVPYDRLFADRGKVLLKAFFALVCAALLVMTMRQVSVWKDDRTLFGQVVRVRPDSFLGYLKLGNDYMSRGDHYNALANYLEALERKDDNALLFNNAGIIYSAKNNHRKAIECYDRALKLDPGFAQAHYNKALSLIDLEEGEKAFEELEAAGRCGFDPSALRVQEKRARVLLRERNAPPP